MDNEEGVVFEKGDEPLADSASGAKDADLDGFAFERVQHLEKFVRRLVLRAEELELDGEVVCGAEAVVVNVDEA